MCMPRLNSSEKTPRFPYFPCQNQCFPHPIPETVGFCSFAPASPTRKSKKKAMKENKDKLNKNDYGFFKYLPCNS